MRRRQIPQHAGLVRRVLVEAVDAVADNLVGAEVRQLAANRVFGFLEQTLHGMVGVDDGAVGVGDHDPGRHIVQRDLDARHGVGLARGLGHFEAEAVDHGFEALLHGADFVIADDVDLDVVVAAGEVPEDADERRQRLADRTQQPDCRGDTNYRDGRQQRQDLYARPGIGDVHRAQQAGQQAEADDRAEADGKALPEARIAQETLQPPPALDDAAVLDAEARRALLAEQPVGRLASRHLVARRLAPQRHDADHLAVFPDRRGVSLDPVKVAVLAAVLDVADPGPACQDIAPEIGKGFGRHVRMAHDVVRLADQFLLRETGDVEEVLIDVGDATLQIGLGDDRLAVFQHDLFVGHGQVGAHGLVVPGVLVTCRVGSVCRPLLRPAGISRCLQAERVGTHRRKRRASPS